MTNLCQSHFLVKNRPITIGGTTYQCRGWGAGDYGGTHTFYATNDLTDWTEYSQPFPFPDPFGDQIFYGFHDIVGLNGHYLGFAESAGGNTYFVESDKGDQNWSVVARVGGIDYSTDPLHFKSSTGTKPSGNFVLMYVDGQLAYGKLMTPGNAYGAYLAINRAAAQAGTPALAQAAFEDPSDWTWRDGSAGAPSTDDEALAQTADHNISGTWILPMSDPRSDYVILYTADYTTDAAPFGIGCAAQSTRCLVEPPLSPPSSGGKLLLPATGFAPGCITLLSPQLAGKDYKPATIQLDIPELGVEIPVVAVPQVDGIWDVSWLGDQAGYLEGRAFPTLPGNSVIAGHVYDAYGNPGPFVNLSRLTYGDQVILHAWGDGFV